MNGIVKNKARENNGGINTFDNSNVIVPKSVSGTIQNGKLPVKVRLQSVAVIVVE